MIPPPPRPGGNWASQALPQPTNNSQAQPPVSPYGQLAGAEGGPAKPTNFAFKEGVHFPQPKPQFMPSSDESLGLLFDLLPQELDVESLLQSNNMIQAWFNHLTVSMSKKEAESFSGLVQQMQTNPALVEKAKQHRMKKNQHSATLSNGNYYNTVPNPSTMRSEACRPAGAAILAQELEVRQLQS